MSWRDTIFVWRGSLTPAVSSAAEGAVWEGRWVGVVTRDASAAMPADADFDASPNHFGVAMEAASTAVAAAAHTAAAVVVDCSTTMSITARAAVTEQPSPKPSSSTSFSAVSGRGWMLDGEWHVDTVHEVKIHHPGRAFATGHNDYGPFITCGTVDLDGGESLPPLPGNRGWVPANFNFQTLLVLLQTCTAVRFVGPVNNRSE